jgi:hypothetical protein
MVVGARRVKGRPRIEKMFMGRSANSEMERKNRSRGSHSYRQAGGSGGLCGKKMLLFATGKNRNFSKQSQLL